MMRRDVRARRQRLRTFLALQLNEPDAPRGAGSAISRAFDLDWQYRHTRRLPHVADSWVRAVDRFLADVWPNEHDRS